MTIWIELAQAWCSRNSQRLVGAFVVMHSIYAVGSRLRVVIEPIYMFFSNEGFGVQIMNRTHDYDVVNVV